MKKLLAILMCIVLTFSLTGCGLLLETLYYVVTDEEWDEDWDSEYSEEYGDDTQNIYEYEADDTADIANLIDHIPNEDTGTDWVIYWYLCGSDLETDIGSATEDLYEMMEVDLPEGVQVVIEAAGAYEWQNDFISDYHTERYLYDSNGLQLIEQNELTNMGEASTFASFLEFCETNYPGDRTMVNIWNHGGGSVDGAAFDENFDYDSLTLTEMGEALSMVYGDDNEYYPIDIMGFDTCLMATLSTAYTFSSHANYLVASQEYAPSVGWNYEGMLDALAQNPTMSPAELSVVICDTYVEGCEYYDLADDITMSVTDLSRLWEVVDAFENYGISALDHAINDPSFFTQLDKVAHNVENYGGNSREMGYSNMVDMGQLVLNTSDLFPNEASAVVSAIDDAVIYKIDSIYRPDGMGISTYYHYDGDVDKFLEFTDVNPVLSLNYLYLYGLTGEVDAEGLAFMEEYTSYTQETQELPELETIETYAAQWEDMPLYIDEDGTAILDLGPEAYDVLSTIAFELYYSPADNDTLISLGSDNDLIADWENGIFMDNFRGVWGHLDGAICYMELMHEGDDYNEYTVPVLLNGEEYSLAIVYDFNIEEYIIMGARKPISEEGAADRNLITLQEGDVIQTIHYVGDLNDDEDFRDVTVDTITVTQNTAFTEEWLPDGFYFFMFRMEDSRGNMIYSDLAMFESLEGELYAYE